MTGQGKMSRRLWVDVVNVVVVVADIVVFL